MVMLVVLGVGYGGEGHIYLVGLDILVVELVMVFCCLMVVVLVWVFVSGFIIVMDT